MPLSRNLVKLKAEKNLLNRSIAINVPHWRRKVVCKIQKFDLRQDIFVVFLYADTICIQTRGNERNKENYTGKEIMIGTYTMYVNYSNVMFQYGAKLQS